MADAVVFPEGGYRYIKAVFQYSGGVAAQPGFEIERVRFKRPVPLMDGFAAVEQKLRAIGRPTTAFCACELRSPAPFDEAGFRSFNQQYVTTLERWGLYRDGVNPVGRTNVCPVFEPPAVPSLYAFSYTVPAPAGARPTFIIAGGGEAPEGRSNYRDHIVRLGDTSPDAMREKVQYVVKEMENRLAVLGFTWRDVNSTQAYTIHDIGPLVGPEIVQRGAAPGGVNWQFCRPPIVDLEYEMDTRAPARELVL